MRRRGGCWRWRIARSASSTRRWRSASAGCARSRTARWRATRWPPARGATCRPAPRTRIVEAVFDGFAASFDAKLAQLMYRAPELVAAMLAESGIEAAKTFDVLDAGCGTGLCGPLLTPYARGWSAWICRARMLDQARERHVYDELVKGELTAYLAVVSRGVRRDRVGRHAGLFRRARRGDRGGRRGAAAGRTLRLHRGGARRC